MKVDTRNIRSATQVARGFSSIIDEVEDGSTIIVVRNNRPVTAIAPISTIERLDGIAEREEDLYLLAFALTRAATASESLRDWDEVAAELGIDLVALKETE